MESIILPVIWLIIYWYYAEQASSMEKGTGKRILGFALTAACLALSFWLFDFLAWLLVAGVMALYDLFFDQEPFGRQWKRILLPGLCIAGICLLAAVDLPVSAALKGRGSVLFVLNGPVILMFLLLLSGKRQSLRPAGAVLTTAVYFLLSLFLWMLGGGAQMEMAHRLREAVLWGGVLVEDLLLLAVEGTLFFYKKGFEFQTEQFRRELMEHQYGEIKSVYMDMRGWRHDYHNHMQVMKAQLAMGNFAEIQEYLDALEKELDRVDTLVKSGNMMVDAILNSKLSLIRSRKIPLRVKAVVPAQSGIGEVDLCVIIGNLLDNAMEACLAGKGKDALRERMAGKAPLNEDDPGENAGERPPFIRIYIGVLKDQLYISVANSSFGKISKIGRRYLSTKESKGHGYGLMRIDRIVERYHGYLNRQNEEGAFVTEVMLPLG